jgi:hypothetical protein
VSPVDVSDSGNGRADGADRSVVAIAPLRRGPGYWAGAPSTAESDGDIYLAYRLRRPRDRGGRLHGKGDPRAGFIRMFAESSRSKSPCSAALNDVESCSPK